MDYTLMIDDGYVENSTNGCAIVNISNFKEDDPRKIVDEFCSYLLLYLKDEETASDFIRHFITSDCDATRA